MVSPGRVSSPTGAVVYLARGPVSRILFYAVIPLGAALPLRSSATYPEVSAIARAALPHRADAQPAPGSSPRLPSLFGLAPCGVYPATGITAGAVRSYRTFSPLPGLAVQAYALRTNRARAEARTARRYVFCGTSRPRALKPASRTLSGTLPCGVRTFLPRQPLLAQGLPAATARSSCHPGLLRVR